MTTPTDFDQQLVRWRHHLHRHPETGFNEVDTADYVARHLAALGLDVHRGIGGTGVVASLTVGSSPRSIGLRADMDALAMGELAPGREHASQNAGCMHACGHDGHMAMVLGAAQLLAERRDFDGTVRFIFQPAEEHGKGAAAMMADGLFQRFPVDEIYGAHNIPGMPAGHMAIRSGGIMASEDNFVIEITGRGGHAARPHMAIDPLVIGAEIVLALQTVVARSVDPSQPAVVSCTEFTTDGIRNALPTHATIKGDTRSYSPAVQALLEKRMREICEGICAAHGATCRFTYTHEFAPTVNWPACVEVAVTAAQAVIGAERLDTGVTPMMISEDFGAFLQVVPGAFMFIGNGEAGSPGGVPLHNAAYDFNDAVLPVGARYFAELARVRLPLNARVQTTMLFNNPAATRRPYDPALQQVMNLATARESRQWLAGWAQLRRGSTPLHALPHLARQLGLGGLYLKDESMRSPLASFKVLGAPVALLRLVLRQWPEAGWAPVDLLAGRHADALAGFTAISATDGNHGRALAAAAQSMGCRCVIVLHAQVSAERERPIRDLGAEVVRITGNYDDSVQEAERLARTHGWWVVSDTSYEGYEDIPRDVMQGYGILVDELLEQMPGVPSPFTHVMLQGGVGGLAAGVVAPLWERYGEQRPTFIVVEPEQADCLLQSAIAGRPSRATGSVDSVMAGLACGETSPLAWRFLQPTVDHFMTVGDAQAEAAMRTLAGNAAGDVPVLSGESGAAGLAGLAALMADPVQAAQAGLDAGSRVLLISTEGATAPGVYEAITGRSPAHVLQAQAEWMARPLHT